MYYELLLKNNPMVYILNCDILTKMFKALFILTRIYCKEKVSRLSSPSKGFKVITYDYYYMLTT